MFFEVLDGELQARKGFFKIGAFDAKTDDLGFA